MALNIKAAIKAHNLTSKEVAARMGITTVGLSQHVNGNPSVDVLTRIAQAIGCDISELFDKPEVHANSVQLTCPYCHRSITLNVDSLENMTE